MSEDNKKMTKEEKIEKAKELIQDLNALELSDEEFKDVNGGNLSPEVRRWIEFFRSHGAQ